MCKTRTKEIKCAKTIKLKQKCRRGRIVAFRPPAKKIKHVTCSTLEINQAKHNLAIEILERNFHIFFSLKLNKSV